MDSFANRLIIALQTKNMSSAELSRRTGIDEGTISNYRKGKYVPKQRKLDLISTALNVSIAWLMGADVPMDRTDSFDIFSLPNISPIPKMKKVPRLGTIACGEPILAEQNIDGYDLIDEKINCDFTLVCKGDSMINARINDGDIVYIRMQPDVDNGNIAAVLIGESATLKRVYKYSDKLVLQSENPFYEPFVYTGAELNEIRILGKAVGFTSKI